MRIQNRGTVAGSGIGSDVTGASVAVDPGAMSDGSTTCPRAGRTRNSSMLASRNSLKELNSPSIMSSPYFELVQRTNRYQKPIPY